MARPAKKLAAFSVARPAKKLAAPSAPLPVGRPCLLAPDVRQRLLSALRSGNYRSHAALYAGIAPSTLFGWLKKGREHAPGDEEFLELLESVKKAEGAAIVRNMQIVQMAATKHWAAAGWWLERKHPKKFGRRDQNRVEMSGPDGGAIAISSGVVVLPAVTDDDA